MDKVFRNRNEAILGIADGIGDLIQFWGFPAHCGRVWALLYLNPDPLTAAQISERLNISTGLTSQTINELLRWEVIRRIRRTGRPGFLYEEETNVWKCITRVLQEREMRLLGTTVERLTYAIETVKASGRDNLRNHLVSRLETLLILTKGVKGFLGAFTSAGRLDTMAFRKLLEFSFMERSK